MKKYPERIDAWQTEDGRIFPTETAASWHQKDIVDSRVATRLIEAGDNLAHVLEAIDQPWPVVADLDLLKTITKDSLLIISHWQCRDQPGYSLLRRHVGGGFFVHGHAGSWSGPYGDVCSVADILRYARDTMQRSKGMLPTRAA